MKPKKLKALFFSLFCIGCFCASPQVIQADELSTDTVFSDESTDFLSFFRRNSPDFNYYSSDCYSLDKNGNTCISLSNLYNPLEEAASFYYEVEMSTDSQFINPVRFETEDTTLKLNKKQFGTNGGKFFFRVRACVTPVGGAPVYSQWSEAREFIYVKINKTNFPGMYTLLKDGGKYMGMEGLEKEIYDKNKDSWLDPKEIDNIFFLCTAMIGTKKNGVYSSYPSSKVSSLEGIQYLPKVNSISLAHYSGKKADLSQNQITSVSIRGVASKELTVIAPDATSVFIETDYSSTLTKMDLSACPKALEITAYGQKSKTLKLPKVHKNLKLLHISDFNFKTLDVNCYPNLQQLYIYRCGISNVKVDKCKKLSFLYLYCSDKIKSLNTTKNTKLKGIDLYYCKGLQKSAVKVYKKTKLTWNKGKWWYGTKDYQNDLKKVWPNITFS